MKNSKTFMASVVTMAIFSIAIIPMAQSAFAEPDFTPGEENWGKATKWLAEQEVGAVGDHSSTKDCDFVDEGEPGCTGLGNLKNEFGSWCALLEFLNEFDDDAVLTCAEQSEG